MDVLFVTTISVLLQCATVVLALRLIRISQSRLAWIGISVGILGMAFRRGMTLFRILAGETPQSIDLAYETVGLFTSLFMFVGVYFIAPIFESIRNNEEKLRKSEEEYRGIIETAQEGIWIIDLEGKTQFVNRCMADKLGYTQEELKGRFIGDFFAEGGEGRAREILERRKRGIKDHYDLRLLKKDGTELWGIVSGSPIQGASGNMIGSLGMFTDITDRKHLEVEREAIVESLQEALSNVKALSGLLPICSSCKKIRDDNGYWNQIEEYIRSRSEAEFSHSICPDCRKRLYPEFHR